MFRLSLMSILILSSTTFAASPDELKARDEIAEFLKTNVVDRVHGGKGTHLIADGRMEADWDSRRVIRNLQVTPEGLKFEYELEFKQTNHALDANKKRTGETENKDRTLIDAWEFAKTDTNELFGFRRSISNTEKGSDPTGGFSAARAVMENGKLKITMFSPFYGNFYDVNKKTFPGRTVSVIVYSIEKGKLKHLRTSQAYKVDPVTLENIKDLGVQIYDESEK